MTTKQSTKKKTVKKQRNIPRGSKKIGCIVSAREQVGKAAFELAKCKMAAKQANEAYNSAIEKLLKVIDNDTDLPLFDHPPAAKKKGEKKTSKKKDSNNK